MKLLKLGEVVLDGSKIKASAAKRSTLRWGQAQQQVLELETQVEALLAQAEPTDGKEAKAADVAVAQRTARQAEAAGDDAPGDGSGGKTQRPEGMAARQGALGL